MQVSARPQHVSQAEYEASQYPHRQPAILGPARSMTYDHPSRTSVDEDAFRPPPRLYSLHHNNSTPNLASHPPQYDLEAEMPQVGQMRLSNDFQRPALNPQYDHMPPLQRISDPTYAAGLPPRPRPSSSHEQDLYTQNNSQMRMRKSSIHSLPPRQHSITASEAGLYEGVADDRAGRTRSVEGRMSDPAYFQSGEPAYQQQYDAGYQQDPNYAMSGQYFSPDPQYGYYNEPGPSTGPAPGQYQQGFDPYQYQQQRYDSVPPLPSIPSAYNNGMQSQLHRNQSNASSMIIGTGPMRQASNLTHSTSNSSLAASTIQRKRTNTGQPITKAAIDEYRNRIKEADQDPETQFNFAKYLIEAARKLGQASASSSSESDTKSLKRYRDALLQESLKLIKKLATQSTSLGKPAYADAQFFYANLLSSGSLGLAVDHERAYNLYVQASKQNHAAATYRTAVCNEIAAGTKRDFDRAVLFYRKASALGDPAGMYKLGMVLLNGLLGQPRNGKEAVLWLKRAAQQADEDHPHALHELGLLYEKPPMPGASAGPTVHPDEVEAFELFMQAAKLGYPPSQHKLGMCYEFGALTCPVDPRRSIAFYTKAAEKGHASSELALSGWYLTGSEGVLQQSDQEAFLWSRRAANKGLPKAEYAVGYYFELGIGVKQDVEEAKRWYMRASAQNHKRAMQRLTELKRSAQSRTGKKAARPTRQEASTECVIC